MRRTSVSLPTNKQPVHDPFEKPDRYYSDHRGQPMLEKMKDSWMAQSQRMRWAKTGAVVFAVLCLFLWFSPSGSHVSGCMMPNAAFATPGTGQAPADSSYGTDQCARSYSSEKPIVQYVLMIDAGSTGSRIHVYKFNNCGPVPQLESEEFKMTEKSVGGLSNFKNDPVAAAKSLDPLLKVAMDKVPEKLKGCSPVAVKATAGLRLIGKEQADAILKEVRRHLEQDYPFPVVSDEQQGVAIMDGSDEGVYAWITTNYLLGNIGGPDVSTTAATLDLGGGSTQIVFQPTFKGTPNSGMPEKLAEGDHKYELDFAGTKFDLYQHSHLGFGLMSARKAIHETLIKELIESKGDDKSWMNQPVVHPCFPPSMSQAIDVKVGDSDKSFNFTAPPQASTAQCRNLAEKILHKGEGCKLAPCSFNGIHQPSMVKTFAKEDVYILSYFYDRTKPLGMPDSFTLREMHDLTQTVCSGPAAWDVFHSLPEAMEELADRPEHCLDLNFMMALLHTGYEMPIDREVKIAKKIDNNELGWCLGASLPLLAAGSGWECKVKQVV
ncbi:nucleoside phosphatase family-domain-containing protein [Stachybotrys elegans]|uniref:guanosine-diphosphatase n=1 Tax=Stachybotrys elegans TaxID=80388 RepID=A0A8K0SPV2_9HYPO|nr:nucleoside phosphatase family-domain-containing protein [Stachybotrys elegans]